MRNRRASLRLLPILIIAGACASPEARGDGLPPAGGLRHFDSAEVSIDYPAEWTAGAFDVHSSFSTSIVYLSTSALRDPCDRAPNSIDCIREAAAALQPNGLLVAWSQNGFPGWALDQTTGRKTTISGRTAVVEETTASDACRAIAGEREMVATIADPVADPNWTEVRACLRGPDLASLRARIDGMLASVRWNA